MDAARHWAGWTPPAQPALPGARDDSLAAFGLAPEGTDAAASNPEDDYFELLPENEAAVRLFLDCETQWRVAIGMSGGTWLGFDYAGVRALMHALKVPNQKAAFEDLMLMERAALGALARLSRSGAPA